MHCELPSDSIKPCWHVPHSVPTLLSAHCKFLPLGVSKLIFILNVGGFAVVQGTVRIDEVARADVSDPKAAFSYQCFCPVVTFCDVWMESCITYTLTLSVVSIARLKTNCTAAGNKVNYHSFLR